MSIKRAFYNLCWEIKEAIRHPFRKPGTLNARLMDDELKKAYADFTSLQMKQTYPLIKLIRDCAIYGCKEKAMLHSGLCEKHRRIK